MIYSAYDSIIKLRFEAKIKKYLNLVPKHLHNSNDINNGSKNVCKIDIKSLIDLSVCKWIKNWVKLRLKIKTEF